MEVFPIQQSLETVERHVNLAYSKAVEGGGQHGCQLAARRSSAGWLIPSDAVSERSKGFRKGRPPSPQTAWSVIALLAAASELASEPEGGHGVSVNRLVPDRKARHRILRMLAGMPDPAIDDMAWRRLLSSRGHIRVSLTGWPRTRRYQPAGVTLSSPGMTA